MVQVGRFRKDLLFRLYTVSIELPPLRDRGHDIRELAVHFMMKLCERYGAETKGFSPDFFTALSAYDWPGNVRELGQAMERALAVARYEPTLFPRHLPTPIRIRQARASVSGRTQPMEPSVREPLFTEAHPTLQEVREATLARVERQYLHDLIQITNRNMKEACRLSGLSRSRLYHLLHHYGIERS
jgi:two-component system NtrC family response regulator